MSKSVITLDAFSPEAGALRRHFEERFGDPRGADPKRFVWDYWHVPGQYTALRTPAYHFFPPKLYRALHERLVLWGRRHLGCHDISPPWLSCYVDGCRQEFHSDLPHGPWAFVFSLTPWAAREFSGGETFLLKPEMMSFWQNLDRFGGLEENAILRLIEPRFNRLTVFDPRIPHGVRRVEGVQDPRQGRLVIHGWFVQPRPFIEGPLRRRSLQRAIEALQPELERALAGLPPVRGILSARFEVGRDGKIRRWAELSNTLSSPEGRGEGARGAHRALRKFLEAYRFERQSGISSVTLPLVFEE